MKYLVFDFDGTIVDNLPQVLGLLQRDLLKRNIDIGKYNVEELRQTGVAEFMKKIHISKLELFKIYKNIKSNIHQQLEQNPPVKGLGVVLQKLSADHNYLSLVPIKVKIFDLISKSILLIIFSPTFLRTIHILVNILV